MIRQKSLLVNLTEMDAQGQRICLVRSARIAKSWPRAASTARFGNSVAAWP
jgi:hypothetical protein